MSPKPASSSPFGSPEALILGNDPPPAGSVGQEARALVRLAVPLAAANLGQVLLGAVDTAVVGRLGAEELGAAGLGNSLFFVVSIFGLGAMMGLDPLVSQAYGAGEPRLARRIMWQGLWLSAIAAVPLGTIMWLLARKLELAGVDAAAAHHAGRYVDARLWGLLPFLAFGALRSYLQSVGRAAPMLYAVLIANLLNLPLTWFLVFGDAGFERVGLPALALGLPALGIAGAGYASAICTLLQLGVLVLALRRIRVPDGEEALRRPEPQLMRRAAALGVPVGLTLLAEVGIFALTNVAMGNIGPTALAAHQVAITLASATFMVPLGIGAAASVRVGGAIGRGDQAGVRRAGFVSLAASVSFMACGALCFWLLPKQLARIITDQPEVVAAAVPLLLVAAVFQVSDGSQAVLAGALRGAGDTRIPLILNLAGYYAVAAPLGIWLAFSQGYGARGLWWGLSAGLTCVALMLGWRFVRLTRRNLLRV